MWPWLLADTAAFSTLAYVLTLLKSRIWRFVILKEDDLKENILYRESYPAHTSAIAKPIRTLILQGSFPECCIPKRLYRGKEQTITIGLPGPTKNLVLANLSASLENPVPKSEWVGLLVHQRLPLDDAPPGTGVCVRIDAPGMAIIGKQPQRIVSGRPVSWHVTGEQVGRYPLQVILAVDLSDRDESAVSLRHEIEVIDFLGLSAVGSRCICVTLTVLVVLCSTWILVSL